MQRPKRFVVGVILGPVHGGGYLDVIDGRAMITPSRATSFVATKVASLEAHSPAVMEQRGGKVGICTARLMPPWISVRARFDTDAGEVIVSVPIVSRRSLIETLQRNGFEVEAVVRWASYIYP